MRSNRPPWAAPHPGWEAPAGPPLAAAAGGGEARPLSRCPRSPRLRRPKGRPPPANPYLLATRPALVIRMPEPEPPQLWISDPAEVARVIEDSECVWQKGKLTHQPFRSLVPLHLIAAEGSQHARLRAVVQPLVSGASLRHQLFPVVRRHAAALCDALAAAGEAERVDFYVRQMTLDTITDALFGDPVGALRRAAPSKLGAPVRPTPGEPLSAAAALGVVMEHLHWRATDIADTRWRELLHCVPGPAATAAELAAFWAHPAQGPEVSAALRCLDEFVAAAMRNAMPSDPAARHTDRRPLLHTLMDRAAAASPPLSAFEQRQLVMTLLTMGHENVSSGVSFALLLLADDPELQRRARREVLAQGEKLDFAALGRLPLLCRVLEEATRLYPSVPGLTRQPLVDATVCGYRVPQGTEVVLNLVAAHRAAAGPDPDCSADGRSLAFGGGRRGCLGRHLAYLEALMVCAELLRRGELQRVGSGGRPPPKIQGSVMVSLRPGKGEAHVNYRPLANLPRL
eukprot:TRINITY_DN9073_c0_g1_i1.p1 TRINITY_DN9073_c0_g1~~TRINITY_DN9073_c0_g1_i1.p1  ORF type:complete len:547 (+),score=127.74 TRINITY_DN9073_c0_g1_i1:104-1642(+)